MNMAQLTEPVVYSWNGSGDDYEDDDTVMALLNNLNFSPECLEGDGFGEDFDATMLGPIPSDVALTGLAPFPHNNITDDSLNAPFKLKACAQTQQLNDGDEKSAKPFLGRDKHCEVVMYQTQSPDSVLESNSATSFCSIRKEGGPIKPGLTVPVRARSKRVRSSTANPWLLIPPLQTSSFKKKAKRKFSRKPNGPANDAPWDGVFKKCTHCEVTKTPQWREGPLGPKTLCNACGVRYRSRRLFPEYRPAASPTFIPSLHSNSHRKVIEMRRKVEERETVQDPPMSPIPEFVPKSSYLFD
ncbi:unnamed protein product [Cuscuta epithymum]|uniref:GATA-type domain-containing protein n=1 Tax=Cuscuta epithymum TaxID=186058 RepID=A0AAV0FKE7_9ASTE|nr:unnamed protein product [Cuscuta epithymum]